MGSVANEEGLYRRTWDLCERRSERQLPMSRLYQYGTCCMYEQSESTAGRHCASSSPRSQLGPCVVSQGVYPSFHDRKTKYVFHVILVHVVSDYVA